MQFRRTVYLLSYVSTEQSVMFLCVFVMHLVSAVSDNVSIYARLDSVVYIKHVVRIIRQCE